MRRLFRGSVMAMLLGLFSLSSVSAQPFDYVASPVGGAANVRVQYYGYGSDYGYRYGYSNCEDLRRACQYKDRLGEWGQGNCRRYYQQCGRGPGYCAQLRRACLYKYEYGQVGRGNCERYREECRGERY